jgi:hypothetical protein
MKIRLLILIALALTLVSCSDDEKSYAQMSEDNVFKDQVDSLDKARSVEATIQSSFDQRGEQAEQ